MYFPKVAPPAVHGNGAAINNAWKRVKGQNKLTVLWSYLTLQQLVHFLPWVYLVKEDNKSVDQSLYKNILNIFQACVVVNNQDVLKLRVQFVWIFATVINRHECV